MVNTISGRKLTCSTQTVDTDVLVLASANFNKLYAIGLREQWLLFGTDKKYRNIPVHRIASEIGSEMC